MNSSQVNNGALSIAVGISLTLIAAVLMTGLGSWGYLDAQNKALQLIVEINDQVDFSEVDLVLSQLKQNPSILAKSVKYISRNDGMQWLSQQAETNLIDQDLPNPLKDIIVLQRTGNAVGADQLSALVQSIKSHQIVSQVIVPSDKIRQLSALQNYVSYAVTAICLLLFVLFYQIVRMYFRSGFELNKLHQDQPTYHLYQAAVKKNGLNQVFWSNLMVISLCIFAFSYFFQNDSVVVEYFTWKFLISTILILFLGSLLLSFVASTLGSKKSSVGA